jgi:epoxide hydrolase 4
MLSDGSERMQVRWMDVNGIGLRVTIAGPAKGSPLVFLHGFPEAAELSWRYQLDWFATKGYQVIAIDQRGYNLSGKPRRVVDYRLDLLARDVIGVIRVLGYKQVVVVGHDWGGAVAWHLADFHAEVVQRAIILNCPHGVAFKQMLLHNPRQWLLSWYMLFFQLPWLPECVLAWNDYFWLRRVLRTSARPGTFSAADLAEYVEMWRQPGALHSMLNWYRSLVRYPIVLDPSRKIMMPVLMLWGEQDRFLLAEMAEPSIEMCDVGRLICLPEASHWLQHEVPEEVNSLIHNFLQAG